MYGFVAAVQARVHVSGAPGHGRVGGPDCAAEIDLAASQRSVTAMWTMYCMQGTADSELRSPKVSSD